MGLVPDLTDDIRFLVGLPDPIPKLLPERIIVDFAGHIEPPAVDAEIDPVFGDVEDELAHGRRIRVELGQGRDIPPGAITDGFQAVLPGLQGLEFG
jgi:hypothetical protein